MGEGEGEGEGGGQSTCSSRGGCNSCGKPAAAAAEVLVRSETFVGIRYWGGDGGGMSGFSQYAGF